MVSQASNGLALVCLLALGACGHADGSRTINSGVATSNGDDLVSMEEYGIRARARIFDEEGERIGDVTACQGRNGVLIQIDAIGLPEGGHGVHLHATGTCADVG